MILIKEIYSIMREELRCFSDRELLEAIYELLIRVHTKLDRIDDDERQFGINLAADIFGTLLQQRKRI